MPVGFPPIPVYPQGLDSDTTLFKVYNTAEAPLSANNSAWADEVAIEPASVNEQWADNGFATLSGEIFYYDAVEKNIDGKVYKLKRCARNLGGTHTKNNIKGTYVRGFVLAEHHNQMVDAVLLTERYFKDLEARVDRLIAEPTCLDDCAPTSTYLKIDTLAKDTGCNGTIISYTANINDDYSKFALNFGDGSSTTLTTGTHTYLPGANIEPTLLIGNDCGETITTPHDVATINEPTATTTSSVLEVPIPEIPEFPQIIIPEIDVPETTLTLPQIVLPCMDIGPIGPINVPSLITIDPAVPSHITVDPIEIPSFITIANPIPSLIAIDGYIPANITIIGSVGNISLITTPLKNISLIGGGSIPSVVSIIGGFTLPTTVTINYNGCLSVDYGTPSAISVIGIPSSIQCSVIVSCASTGARAAAEAVDSEEFQDSFAAANASSNEFVEGLNIPSEIKIIAPEMPDIKIKHNLPLKINLDVPKMDNISLIVPAHLPQQISLIGNVPETIRIDSDIPSAISLDTSNLPGAIKLEIPSILPAISLDTSSLPQTIKVNGIPDTIELKGHIPSEIFVKVPENLEVPLVYKGPPIPIKFDEKAFTGENGEDLPCFAIVPCPKK